MKIKDLFKKSIERDIKGVVTIGNEEDLQRVQELEEYVVTNELQNHFRKFFKAYRESLHSNTDKIGVWITGFFGSGKSHFLKILSYLLENKVVGEKEALRYFDEKITDSMVKADLETSLKTNNTVVLFNIDSKAKADAKYSKTAIMEVMLRAFNERLGLCSSIPWIANFERALIEEGIYDDFQEEFKISSNKSWMNGRNKALFERDNIIKALTKVRNMSHESARKYFDDQQTNFYMDTETFAKLVNQYIKDQNARVTFLIDEVGQYIGEHTDLMLNLQTVVEDLGKICKGKAWVVVTSQQGIDEIIEDSKYRRMDFSKIQGRFATRLLMSGSNADEVIKKRILDKTEHAKNPLMSIYEDEKSRISNLITFQSKPTWNGYKSAEEFKDVYPFVPYQFELLQKVFEAIREHGLSEGKHLSQSERSLLSAFQESALKKKDEDLGLLIPFNSFYGTIEQFIDFNIKQVFTNASNRTQIDDFSIEVLKVLFMIKHIKEMPATLERLATLMVSSVEEDKLALKNKIADALKQLEAETLAQKNGEQYDFLTNEEQDINRQINNAEVNESAVIRKVSDAVYDK
ncbi:MAG: BREX system P-loop protein BrxC, partial [bacterium]